MSKWHAELMREMIRISSMLFEGEENKERKGNQNSVCKTKKYQRRRGRRRGEYSGRGRRDGGAKEGGGDREGANLNQVGSQSPNIVLYRFVNRIFTKIQRIIRVEGRGKGEIRERGAWK